MALSVFDFTKGIDFTALASAAAGDHNTLIDDAVPRTDTGVEGKSIIIWTQDSALNTPIVPGADVVIKWKRYVWVRHPHATATSTTPIIYIWDGNIADDPTYKKWVVYADQAAALAAIAALDTRVDAVEVDVVNALVSANAANASAAAAVNDAAAANATATAAANNAATALATANAAQVDATSALAAAASANTTATAAQTTANNALAIVNANLVSRFRQSGIVIAAGKFTGDIAHGFSGVPDMVVWSLVCVNPAGSSGYAENDEIEITAVSAEIGGGDYDMPAFTVGKNATYLYAIYNNNVSQNNINDKATGAKSGFTAADWKVKVMAVKYAN